MIGNPLAEPEDRLAWEIRAVAERLRRLSPARLRTPLPPYPSREQAGRILAQRLADAAAGIVARSSDQPPQWPEVPEIELFAVGEQVAVTGNDLVLELTGLSAGGAAGAGEGSGWIPGEAAGTGEGAVPVPGEAAGAGEGTRQARGAAAAAGEGAGQARGAAAGAGELSGEATPSPTGGPVAGDPAIKAAGSPAGDTVIWTRTGRRPLSAVIDELIATLRELRLGL